MYTSFNMRRYAHSRKGAATIVFLVLLLLILILGAFSAEYARVKLAKTELRIAVDSATRAAASIYGDTQDLTAAKEAAEIMANRYLVAGERLSLDTSEIIAGSVSPQPDGTYDFVPDGLPINAFRIEAGFTEESSLGPLDTLFSAIHHVDEFQVLSRSTVAEIDLDIVLVLDRSGSMAWDMSGESWQYPDGNPWWISYFLPPHPEESRWAALESALNVFVDVLEQKSKQEYVAVTSYSTQYEVWSGYFEQMFYSDESTLNQNLTDDYQLIRTACNDIGNEPIIGGTAISAGMDLGTQCLIASPRAESAYKVMIVLTDGQWNAGRNPIEAAVDAAAQGVKIYSITFSENADIETMQGVADVGGGTLYHAVTQEELEDAFRQIANSLEMVFTE